MIFYPYGPLAATANDAITLPLLWYRIYKSVCFYQEIRLTVKRLGGFFVTLIYFFIWLVFYSFAGWVYESILCSVKERKPVNRGFLNGPICPVYGFGAVLLILTFYGRTDRPAVLFFGGAVLTCALEYFTSYLLEKLFHTRWWDYSHMRFNLNGRICLLGAVAFGAFSLILVKWFHPSVDAFTRSLPPLFLEWASAAIFLLIMSDTTVTVHHILLLNGRLSKIQEAINGYREQVKSLTGNLQDQTRQQVKDLTQNLLSRFELSEFYTDKIKDLLQIRHYMDRRIANAFPTIRWNRTNEAWKKIVEHLNLYKSKKDKK